MMIRNLMLFSVCLLMGCSAVSTSIPLGTSPDAPIATAQSFRFFWDSNVSVTTPDGINLTYGSKPSENTPLTSFWMKTSIDSLTALANSQAAQAAMRGYMMGSGHDLPGIGVMETTNGSALQSELKSAGCPLADKLSPTAFNSLLGILAQEGVPLNVEALLPVLGGKK